METKSWVAKKLQVSRFKSVNKKGLHMTLYRNVQVDTKFIA